MTQDATPRSRRGLVLGVLLTMLLAIGLFAFVAINGWPWRRTEVARTTSDARPAALASSGRTGDTETTTRRSRRQRPTDLPRIVVTHDPSVSHGSFEGRVLSAESGAGVGDAELTFTHGRTASSVRTNEDGHFVFLPQSGGPHAIATITAEGYLPFAPALGQSPLSFVARAGERLQDVVLFLDPAREMVAIVLDPEGQPVEGAEVRLIGLERGEAALAAMQDRFVTDAQGEVRFQAPDGTGVEARKDGYMRARNRIGRDERESGRVELRLAVGEDDAVGQERLSGRVVGPNGEAIEGASVRGRTRPGLGGPGGRGMGNRGAGRFGMGSGSTAVTDAEGRFELDGLHAGSASVVATHVDFLPAQSETEVPTSAAFEIRLEAGAILEGTVRARSGEPVAAFNVIVMATRGLERHPIARRTFLDSQGHFEMRGLRGGTFLVTAAANGYAQPTPVEVTIPGTPGSRAHVRLELGRGGRVSGTVLAENGRAPVAGARVSVMSSLEQDGERVPTSSVAVTDASGHFELVGVTPGARSLGIRAPGFHELTRSGISVREGAVTPPLEILLRSQQPGEERAQELVGIGAILGAEGERIVVRRVIEGGGGAAAGLVSGDVILRVDGVAVTELGFEQTMERIRGTEGTTVTLGLLRADGRESDLVVRRRRVRI